MMLVWAQEKGYLAEVPLPKSEMKKGRTQDGADADAGNAAEAPQGN